MCEVIVSTEGSCDYCLSGCEAVSFHRYVLTFHNDLLSPSSECKSCRGFLLHTKDGSSRLHGKVGI